LAPRKLLHDRLAPDHRLRIGGSDEADVTKGLSTLFTQEFSIRLKVQE
jgi:hypothetical protein